jgi:GMP synthase (glutamine-hydrolysing)
LLNRANFNTPNLHSQSHTAFYNSALMKTVAAIRHVHFEDLGAFEPVLKESGYGVRYYEAGSEDLPTELPESDLLVVLGAPIGVYDEDKYPFLSSEIRMIERRLASARPMLGICLGAQLFARALGSRVYPGPAKEIGWAPVILTEAGKQSVTKHFDGVPVLHWHGDTFDLPAGAERLASTAVCQNQAFTYGHRAIAFQFHPEASGQNFERWLIGHAVEIAGVPGLSVTKLRADTERLAPRSIACGQQCLSQWLRGLR